MTLDELYLYSIEIIKKYQDKSGGYVACPKYETYNYCWFRDGSYIAHAMDVVGEFNSSKLFYEWGCDNILNRSEDIRLGIKNRLESRPVEPHQLIDTRYTLDGNQGEEFWENFQLDGIGTWLWALGEHLAITKRELTGKERVAAELACDYLLAHWYMPCFDCWEEFSEYVHTYTLASIYAGLYSAQTYLNKDFTILLDKIKSRIFILSVDSCHFCKYEGTTMVDASLIGLCVPYNIISADNSIMTNTISKIEEDLLREHGVHRYRKDTFYGGGIWILLTAWLGLYYSKCGNKNRVEEILKWIKSKANSEGELPEQLTDHVWDESYIPYWEDKWGKSARPLLWSHAKYILLYSAWKNMQ